MSIVLDRGVAIQHLEEELKWADGNKERNVILALIDLLEKDKIEALVSEHGSVTYYRLKPSGKELVGRDRRGPKASSCHPTPPKGH